MTAGTTRDPATVGPYRLVRKLGEGGMGVVHLATDPAGRLVALKVLRAHVANDEDARRRLIREVATLRRVRHPNVAEVLDADVAGAEPYLVTRFVPGRSLEEEIRGGGALPAAKVARIGRTLAGALAAIHASGVVHRDLKPANVMLVDGDPVLIDFGIAHVADESRITRTGLVMGTPGYLSPELIYGGPVTPATDWWAWGATLAFAATGRQPFGTGPIEVILERVRRGQSDLDGVEPGLRDLLAATLTTDAGARPSYPQLFARLDDVIAGVTTVPSAVDGHGRLTALPNDPTTRTAPPPPGPPPGGRSPSAATSLPAAAAPSAAGQGRTVGRPPLDATKRMPPAAAGGAPADRQAGGVANRAAIPPYPGAHPRAQSQPGPRGPSGPQGQPRARGQFQSQGQQAPWDPRAQAPYAAHPQQYADPAQRSASGYPRQPLYPAAQPGYPWAGSPGPTPQQPWQSPPGAQPPSASPHGQHPSRETQRAPRITGTLAALALALSAVAAVAPGGAIVLAFALSVLARLVQRSSAGLQRRRQELGGSRPTDLAVTVVALPWRLVLSIVMTVVAFLLPALVAMSAAFIVGSGASVDGVPHPMRAGALFAGMLAGAATAWWGPGGRSLRTGSRVIVRSVTRSRGGRRALVALCGLVVLATMIVVQQGGGYSPDWSPFPPPGTWRSLTFSPLPIS